MSDDRRNTKFRLVRRDKLLLTGILVTAGCLFAAAMAVAVLGYLYLRVQADAKLP